ncbi:glycoside hydrolase family 27 protein [Saccharothrix luteola]|uniref:glycoside hydrolase family 27 protein n=1 Tax=Saccharothrix luteola TaxID=2893018 RepID=UPI001E508BA2|nr:glycoside hydrolase family 27 protein [Saccharothrix luteola]MCC8242747.1 glycoside hydrolase family 27 protein [Saccharothrix luteola]
MASLVSAVVVVEPLAGRSASPGLAPTPPMGWNSWNRFGCDIGERLVREIADRVVESGMRDAGYTYLNLDDCWMARERDEHGRLVPDPVKFPDGLRPVADYVHERGLKFGVYADAGSKTCAGYPGSLGHEQVDARSFAEWGVDYLKYDNCNNDDSPAADRYGKMGRALRESGRQIVFSICEWGHERPWEGWGRQAGGHLWRTTRDITDSWASWTALLDLQVGLEEHSGPNGWNDPDMLEVGNGGMADHEDRAHFTMWALLNAPLIAGNDLRAMGAETKDVLLNRDLIAVNQDWGGKQGRRLRDDGEQEVWAKPMSDGSAAVVLFNRASTDREIGVTVAAVGLPSAAEYRVVDLWTKAEGVTTGELRARVPAHSVVAYRVWLM